MKSIWQLLRFAIGRKRRKVILAQKSPEWWCDRMDWEPEDVDQFCDRLVLLLGILLAALIGSWVWFLT